MSQRLSDALVVVCGTVDETVIRESFKSGTAIEIRGHGVIAVLGINNGELDKVFYIKKIYCRCRKLIFYPGFSHIVANDKKKSIHRCSVSSTYCDTYREITKLMCLTLVRNIHKFPSRTSEESFPEALPILRRLWTHTLTYMPKVLLQMKVTELRRLVLGVELRMCNLGTSLFVCTCRYSEVFVKNMFNKDSAS